MPIWSDNLWSAMVDPNELEPIILNLANNARDAMQSSGKLTIAADNTYPERQILALNTLYLRPSSNAAAMLPGEWQLMPFSTFT